MGKIYKIKKRKNERKHKKKEKNIVRTKKIRIQREQNNKIEERKTLKHSLEHL